MKKDITNVLICGIGAIGSIYADKIQQISAVNLKILVDKNRLEKYKNNPIIFNNRQLDFDYVLPCDNNFKADLVIIATKFDGLNEVVKNLENFVDENTIIMSLLNGVTSEKIIGAKYSSDKVLYSYFIGHSAVRDGRTVTHDDVNTVVFGSSLKNERVDIVRKFFDKVGINYSIPDDIVRSMWLKYMLNVSCNQVSAVLGFTFGDLINNRCCMNLLKNVMKEVQYIAKAEGVNGTETMITEAIEQVQTMSPEGKTSMFQDVLAGRKTEVEMFAGTMIDFGKKHNIPTPYNKILKEMIDSIYEKTLI